jgi:hypothetical protein
MDDIAPTIGPELIGATAVDELPDPRVVLHRMTERYRAYSEAQRRRRNQIIRFPNRPVGVAFVADNHIGNDGVDYERMMAEAELMAATDDLYVVQVGDLVDNFIVSKLLALRVNTTVSIPEEWAVADYYLRMLGPKLLAVVGGNHDAWTRAMAGVDQLKQTLAGVRSDALYATDELMVTFEVGGLTVPARIRHKWRYSSVLNPTHGIERAFERDQAKPFLLGVGAHTHVSGLARQFNAGGRTGLSVICGSYKVYDSFAHTLGLAEPNGSTAVVVVFHPDHGMVGFDNLALAVEYLGRFK